MGDFMSGLVVENVRLSDTHTIVIVAKTQAETTVPFAIRANTSYTFICSELASNEEIPIEVYDPSVEDFVQLYDDGDAVKFTSGYHKINFKDESMLIRFVKSITSENVGLSAFYA